jgi:hypothetical protein
VVDRAEEKLMHRISFPAERIFRISAANSPTLTAEVVASWPERILA